MIKLSSGQSDDADDQLIIFHDHPEFPIKMIIMTTIFRWAVTVTSGVCAYPLDSVKRRMMMTAGEEVTDHDHIHYSIDDDIYGKMAKKLLTKSQYKTSIFVG